jgi:hypothetical protein
MTQLTIVDNFKTLIQGFLVNEAISPETVVAFLQSELDSKAENINRDWNIRWNDEINSYPIPEYPSDIADITAINILLELFNLEKVLPEYIANVVSRQSVRFEKQSVYMKFIAKERYAFFLDKRLRRISEDPDNEIQLLAKDVPGFTITDSTMPSITTALQIARRECVFIRALAAQRKYNCDFNTINDAQKACYLDLMFDMVRPQIARIALSNQYGQEIDSMINQKLRNAWDNLMLFFAGNAQYRKLFRGQ